ncbi:MAG TPA: hypothetical protein IGS52_06555 [Oscillatoriaceae cyanobacterium M33_DOE_052]|nr:hypothetical protein [Oscillatoriaceae cyanobacterium M33_DOE_052]
MSFLAPVSHHPHSDSVPTSYPIILLQLCPPNLTHFLAVWVWQWLCYDILTGFAYIPYPWPMVTLRRRAIAARDSLTQDRCLNNFPQIPGV